MSSVLLALCLVLPSFVFAQGAQVKLDKETYKIDEIITVEFHLDRKMDSMQFDGFKFFSKVKGPLESNYTTFVNGKLSTRYSLTYQIRATKAGNVPLETPAFYSDGELFKATVPILTISDEVLSAEEAHNNAFKSFIKAKATDEGTQRILFKGEFAYLERYVDFKWIFVRRLSPTEIEWLQQLP